MKNGLICFKYVCQQFLNLIIRNMGNINNQTHQSQLPPNFKQLTRQQHPILGGIKRILNSHDNTEYILVERVFVTETQFEKCLNKIKNRAKSSKTKQKYQPNQYILEVVDYKTAQESELCGKTFKLFIFLKSFQSDLKTVFNQRQRKNQLFQQVELVELLLSVVNCLIYLYDHGIKAYHLSLESIVVRGKKYKLIDCELTNQMSPIDSLNFKSQLRRGTYIAPQVFCQIMQFQPNTSKSDIFTLGMVILSLCTLRSLDGVYDYSERKVNFEQINSLLSRVNYSSALKNVITQMIEESPEERIGILRLKESLGKMKVTPLYHDQRQTTKEIVSSTALNNNKGLIYLGKHPSTKNQQKQRNHPQSNHPQPNHFCQPTQVSQLSIDPIRERKNSYHKLLNEKTSYREKSISYQGESCVRQEIDKDKEQGKTFIPKNYGPETPHTYIDTTSGIGSTKGIGGHDFSDIRSDTPISPSTLHNVDKAKSQVVLKVVDLFQLPGSRGRDNAQRPTVKQVQRQSPLMSYKIPQFQPLNVKQIDFSKYPFNDKVITKPLQKANYNTYSQKQSIDIRQPQQKVQIQNYPNIKSFQKWIQAQKSKLKTKPQLHLNQSSIQQKPLSIPTFSNFDIQNLQTPRISKSKLIDFNTKSKNTKSITKKQFPQETPIKSLQFMHTDARESKKKIQNTIERIQEEEKIFGRYDFSNGSVYEGEFNNNNQFEGNGILYFATGNVFYSGSWKSNQFHGFGILNNIQNHKIAQNSNFSINYQDFNLNDNKFWTQYEGQFFEDKKHGFGTLFFVNGDKFSGCFVNDSIQGFGNFYRKRDSKTVMGIWTDNIFRQS